jgi:hypothetical protein
MEDGPKPRDFEDRMFRLSDGLAKKARELTLIFSAIISKSGEL